MGGEAQAAAAVRTALVAAQAADEGGGEQVNETARRLVAAGRACATAMRHALDVLGADGTLVGGVRGGGRRFRRPQAFAQGRQ
eukprot:621984-Pleurochrysis_carterae.AAC.1